MSLGYIISIVYSIGVIGNSLLIVMNLLATMHWDELLYAPYQGSFFTTSGS